MKRSSTFGLRLFTSAFLILFTFAQPLLAIESLIPVEDAASTESVVTDTQGDILDEGISDPEEIAKPTWVTSGESATTSSPVVVGETYTYPINPAVTVTFSKLPTVSSSLTIKTIYLTDDQVKATNAASDVAYDITTDMTDGTFEYDLTLPKVGDNTKVVYAENVSGLTDAKDIGNVVENGSSLKINGLDHFTTFVVVSTIPAGITEGITEVNSTCTTVSIGSGTRCYDTIQEAINAASNGETINVKAGTYTLTSQLVISKSLTIVGEDEATTIIVPGFSTGSSGDGRGLILVNNNATVNLSDISIDGNGFSVHQAIRVNNAETFNVSDVTIRNIYFSKYTGFGIALMDTNGTIENVSMSNIERVGTMVFGNSSYNIDNYLYTGKGNGDWLDYGIEMGGGGNANISNSNISDCRGIASSDGSTSGAIMATTYYGSGTGGNIEYSNFDNNSTAILVGYNSSDTSIVKAQYNDFANNDIAVSTAGPQVDARNNSWGTSKESQIQSLIEGNVLYNPWYGKTATQSVTVNEYEDSGVYFVKKNDILNFNISGDPIYGQHYIVGLWGYNSSTGSRNSSRYIGWQTINPTDTNFNVDLAWNMVTTNWMGSNAPGTTIPAGEYILWVERYYDEGGYVSGSTTTKKITVDDTRPTVSVISPLNNDTFNGAVQIEVIASDSQTDIGSVSMHIYNATTNALVTGCTSVPTVFNGTNWIATLNNGGSCNLTEGRYRIAAWAYDSVGNPGWATRPEFNIDYTNPNGTLDGVFYTVGSNNYTINNFETNSNSPMFAGTYSDNLGVEKVSLSLAGFDVDATLDSGTWKSPALGPIVADGTYPLTVTITDLAGNTYELIQNIVIDTKAPTAVYIHYNNGVEVLGAQAFVQSVSQLSFTGTYTDATPSSELYWDSFVIFQAQDNGSFAFAQNGKQSYCSWRQNPNLVELSGNPFTLTTQRQFTDCVATLPEGTYYMTHQVYDNATRKDIPTINQFRDVLGLKFTVDTTVPVSQFTGDDLSGSYNNSPIVISGTSADANGVVSVALLSRPVGSSGDWTIIETISNPSVSNTFTWSTTWEPAEGRYDIKAEATDQAGNTEHSPMMSNIVYDTTNPRVRNVDINIDYFGKYVNGQTGFLISVPVSDNLSGIDRNTCEYSLDGANWYVASYAMGNCGIWIDNDRLFDGQDLLISLAVKDRAGNISSSRVVSREVDTANATSSVNPLNPFYGPNSLPTISGTASDTVSDITDVKIRMTRSSDSKNWIGTSMWSYIPGLQNVNGTDNWVLNKALPSMSNGVTYTVTPYASDEVHGLSAGRSDSFVWDNEVPQNPIRIWSTSHNATPNDDTTIDMRFTGASDNLSGVKGYYYSFSQTPEIPSMSPLNWLSSSANRITSRRLADGIWYFNIITVDNVNNVSSVVSSIAYTIDTQAPNARITAPTATYLSGDVEVKGTVTDVNPHTYSLNVYNIWNRRVAGTGNVFETNSFVDTTIYNLDTTELSDGVYTLRLESRDAAGNQDLGSIDWKIVIVDNTQPTVDLVFETPGESNKGFKAVFSENVNEADAENPANYFLTNYPMYSASSGDLVDDANITYNWRTRTATVTFTNPDWYISPEQQWGIQDIHDLAGNILSTTPYTEYSTPMVAPVTTISETDSDWYNADVTVTLTCADINGSGCYLTHYSLNGGETFETGNQVVVSAEGENTIIFYSEDRAGNVEERQTSKVVMIDKTNPDLSILNPSVTLPIAGTFTIDGTVSDTLSGVNKVTVDLGNGTTAQATLGSSSTWSLDVNDGVLDLADGTYDVTVTAEDISGNTTVETLADLVIDNTNPEAQVLSALSFQTGDTTPRSLALSDNTELSQVCYVIDTNTQTCLPLFGTGYSWDITALINTLSVGTHTFTYYVVDTAGNRSDSNTIVEGNDPYASSVVVAAVPQQAVRGAATVAEVTPEAVQGVQTTEEETTTAVTQEEVKGALDTTEDETNGKPIPWWVYTIGGVALLSFIIFIIARRRKEEEEKEKNIR